MGGTWTQLRFSPMKGPTENMVAMAAETSKTQPTQPAGLSTSLEQAIMTKCLVSDLTMNALLIRKSGLCHQQRSVVHASFKIEMPFMELHLSNST